MSTQAQQVVPSPQEFAWTKKLISWVPVWITIPEVSRACSQLIKCSCTVSVAKLSARHFAIANAISENDKSGENEA